MTINLPITESSTNPIESIVILLESGLFISSINFSQNQLGIDCIVGGFCSAINTFVKEVFDDNIKYIQTFRHKIFFQKIALTNRKQKELQLTIMIVVNTSIPEGDKLKSESLIMTQIFEICRKSLLLNSIDDYVDLDQTLAKTFQISLKEVIERHYDLKHSTITKIA